jgi:small subunit ribosomal protein S5
MRFIRPEKKYEEEVLDIARVTRVTKGGKRLSFRAVVVIGDKKGKIGVGIGKGKDTPIAIQKAKTNAEKKMFFLPLVGNTIPHEVSAKYCAAKVILKPASKGHGLVSGGVVRTICNLIGIQDISSKILGRTSNKLSNARATLLALKKLRSRKVGVKKEEKEIEEIKEEKKEEKREKRGERKEKREKREELKDEREMKKEKNKEEEKKY